MKFDLHRYGLSKIVSIDEAYGLTKKKWKNSDSWIYVQNKLSENGLSNEEIILLGEKAVGETVEYNEYLKDFIELELSDLQSLEIIREFSESQDIELKKIDSIKEFKHYLISADNTLFFIDQFLNPNDGNDYSLLKEILKEILGTIKIKHHSIIIYTNHPDQTLKNGYENVVSYLKGKVGMQSDEAEELSLYVHHLKKSNDRLATTDIIKLLTRSFQANYFYHVTQQFNDIFKRLKLKFYDLGENFDLKSYAYFNEGLQISEVLQGIVLSMIKEKYFNFNRDNIDLINRINDLYFNYSVELGKDKNINSLLIGRVKETLDKLNHLPILDNHIIDIGADVAFGDVFEVTADISSFYMVVSQPCDLTIRLEDNDDERKAIHLLLLNVKDIELNDPIQKIGSVLKTSNVNSSNIQLVEEFVKGALGIDRVTYNANVRRHNKIEFSRIYLLDNAIKQIDEDTKKNSLISTDANFLYLCSFIKEGLDLGEKIDINNARYRYSAHKLIQKAADNYNMEIENLKKILLVKSKKDKSIISQLCSQKYGISDKGAKNIKRIGRLDINLAREIYHEWFLHQFRNAKAYFPFFEE